MSETTGATAASALPAPSAGEPLLEVRGLKKHFPLTQGVVFKRTVGHVRAVDGVDLTLRRGETVDFPQPDSPTRPRVCPRCRVRFTPSTART